MALPGTVMYYTENSINPFIFFTITSIAQRSHTANSTWYMPLANEIGIQYYTVYTYTRCCDCFYYMCNMYGYGIIAKIQYDLHAPK
jgi:hypothetical protein